MNDKLATITNLFEGKEIRSIWDAEAEDYYFSVVDVITVLAEPVDSSDYWTTLKRRLLIEEKSELPTNCRRLKMKAKDGKMRETDTLDTEGILRLIESVPSSKAEPFKVWLVKLGREKVDEVFDPSKGIDQNRKAAKCGGGVARKTKDFFEEETGSKVVSKSNSLNYRYIDEYKLIEK